MGIDDLLEKRIRISEMERGFRNQSAIDQHRTHLIQNSPQKVNLNIKIQKTNKIADTNAHNSMRLSPR